MQCLRGQPQVADAYENTGKEEEKLVTEKDKKEEISGYEARP